MAVPVGNAEVTATNGIMLFYVLELDCPVIEKQPGYNKVFFFQFYFFFFSF